MTKEPELAELLEPWKAIRNQCIESLFWHDEAGWKARTEALATILRTPSNDSGAGLEEAKELLRDAQYHLRVDAWAEQFNGRVKAFLAALSSQDSGREAGLGADVVRLVIAARAVAFGDHRDFTDDRFSELDAASEAFADRVPWENGDEA